MKKFLWIIVVLALIAAAFGAFRYFHSPKKQALDFQSIPVQRGNLKILVATTGSVQSQNRLEIKPPIAGRIEEALAKEGELVTKGQILAWMSSSERAALLDAARAKSAQDLAYWEELYRATPLVAPLDGKIIARKIEPGQTVSGSDVLYVMSDRLIVSAQVDETDIGRVALGQAVELTLDAYPQNIISGRVDAIAYEAKTVNNVTTYAVDVLPLEVPHFFRSGMTANLNIESSVSTNILLLPAEALLYEHGGTFVLMPGNSGKSSTVTQSVEIGQTDGMQTEITDGLQEGDIVLVKKSAGPAKKNSKSNPFRPR